MGRPADTRSTDASRFRFESGTLRAVRSTLALGVSRSRAQARFAYEARRKAGFGSLRSAIREPASACTVQDLTPVALRACGGCSRVASTVTTIETVLSASRARDLQRQLPALSSGEGVLETEFAGYAPVAGLPPTRRWTTANPLNREEYLMHLARRVAASS